MQRAVGGRRLPPAAPGPEGRQPERQRPGGVVENNRKPTEGTHNDARNVSVVALNHTAVRIRSAKDMGQCWGGGGVLGAVATER